MDIVLALVAAFFFGLGLVLQAKAATQLPRDSVGSGFLLRLAREPTWLLGAAAQGVGFVAQAIALGIGRIVIVQPLLITTLVFALPLGRALANRPIARTEWIGATIVTIGLATLLLLSDVTEGADDASLGRWLVIGGSAAGLAALLFVAAHDRSDTVRAALLGTASGLLFGLGAALTKTVVSRLPDEWEWVVAHWHVYALVGVSIAAFWLEQASLQTGALAAAVATTMAFDPLSSLVFGIALFDESLHESAFGTVVSVVSLAVTLGGLVLLARGKSRDAPAAPA